jgi:hypothetical protein
MQRKDVVVRKLQSATDYLETAQEMYQDNEAPLELVHPMAAVVSMLRDIRREVLVQELRSILHAEDLPTAIRKERIGKIFQLLTERGKAGAGQGSPE